MFVSLIVIFSMILYLGAALIGWLAKALVSALMWLFR